MRYVVFKLIANGKELPKIAVGLERSLGVVRTLARQSGQSVLLYKRAVCRS